MAWRRLLLASVALLASGLLALGPGDAAPALDGVTYVKGQAPDFAAQWTLVEFWATWCAPCKRTIPHLTELLKQHGAKLAVVGLSDEDEATVRPFVQAQGEAMGYSVGLVPKDTRERYMQGRSGIPCAFLVSPQKQVAWVGHPAAVMRCCSRPSRAASMWSGPSAFSPWRTPSRGPCRVVTSTW